MRPIRSSDLRAVMEITRLSLPRPWSEAVWREELASPFGLYLVLEENGAISGHIGVKLISDEMHVMTIAVRSERRRRGFARLLVETALADPASADARRVYLEVRPSNTGARALYGSLGFVETGVRPGYYGDEDALLMTLDLRNRPRQ
ncbi:MAG: Ribosomal-protein-S18p-alanine acetyltransferase [uncultured Rubrobacteraceae bacterium]|uniref:[Ribosomal protein bS18]-alanine N-acetyltransferase n=1 Tax=uncultured Rubrobacteraceae bacterium TaxID=349277 RepID=A0A6J4PJB5_9ACTN|nr:MAG: Ribosomal-protein-S18p-alanine acetyltransferase [uncultured Rubrobacteraceae bacterium]